MFAGTSKLKLVGWIAFWAILTLSCGAMGHPTTYILAACFLIVTVVLVFALKSKIDRDASYNQVSQFPDEESQRHVNQQTRNSESDYFGPPTV